jgi:hypothetical protein
MKIFTNTPGTWMVAVVVMSTACSSSQPVQTRFMSENAKLRATAAEMRVMVRDLARPFGGVLEETADAIIADTGDLELREAAVRWKIDAIPAMHEALFRPDPLEAVLDAGTLLMQIQLHFEKVRAADLTPEQRDLVYAAIDSMQRDLEHVMVRAGADLSQKDEFWDLLGEWAREQPVELTFASRRSTVARLAEFTNVTRTGALASVSTLTETAADLTTRMDVYSTALAKQGRWQAELLLIELLGDEGAMAAAVEDHMPIPIGIAGLPFDLDVERDQLLRAIRGEREALQAWARAERLDTLRFMTAEREAVLSTLMAERATILDALSLERQTILDAAQSERDVVLAELERVVADSMVRARNEVVDHALDRLQRTVFMSLGLVFVGAVGLMLLWRWIGRSR